MLESPDIDDCEAGWAIKAILNCLNIKSVSCLETKMEEVV